MLLRIDVREVALQYYQLCMRAIRPAVLLQGPKVQLSHCKYHSFIDLSEKSILVVIPFFRTLNRFPNFKNIKRSSASDSELSYSMEECPAFSSPTNPNIVL